LKRRKQSFDEGKPRSLKKAKTEQVYVTEFLRSARAAQSMGSMTNILGMMPGMNSKALKGATVDERAMARTRL
jgi:signal recognition particle subunit SRP54